MVEQDAYDVDGELEDFALFQDDLVSIESILI